MYIQSMMWSNIKKSDKKKWDSGIFSDDYICACVCCIKKDFYYQKITSS